MFSLLLFTAAIARGQDELARKSAAAKQAMEAGRFAEAEAAYRELLKALPDNPGLRLDLGLALHSEGKFQEAVQEFQAAVRRDASLEPGWFMLGLDYLKLNQTEQAVGPLEHALRLDPQDQRARLELADAYLSLGKPEDARQHFQKLTEFDPNNPKAWQGLGLSYVALSRSAFAALDRLGSRSAYADALLARSLVNQSQYRSAFYWVHQALSQNPSLPGLHAELGEIYRKSGHADWASVEEERERQTPKPDCARETPECDFLAGRFGAVLSKAPNPPTPEYDYWRARACEELALEAFGHLASMPPTAEIHELLAEADMSRRNFHGAVEESREAVRLAPGDAKAQEELARALWLDNDYAEARPLLERLIPKQPESPELNCALGDTLSALGSVDEALPYLEKAVKLAPGSAPAQASLGRAYLHSGRAREAIPHLKAAYASGGEVSLLYQLANAYKQTGQAELARQTMRKFEQASNSALARTQELVEKHDITPP